MAAVLVVQPPDGIGVIHLRQLVPHHFRVQAGRPGAVVGGGQQHDRALDVLDLDAGAGHGVGVLQGGEDGLLVAVRRGAFVERAQVAVRLFSQTGQGLAAQQPGRAFAADLGVAGVLAAMDHGAGHGRPRPTLPWGRWRPATAPARRRATGR